MSVSPVNVKDGVPTAPRAFVMLVAEAAPNTGVVSVGLVDKTTLPEPVEVVTPVPPEATGSVPVVNALVEVA